MNTKYLQDPFIIFLNAYPVQIGEEVGPCTSLNGAESGVQVDQVGILSHLHLII